MPKSNLSAISLFIIAVTLISSCRRPPEKVENREWSDNHSVDYNQEVNEREQIQIKLFLSHYYFLKMVLTDSGLRYMIYKKANAQLPMAKEGQTAEIRLKIQTLDGRVCYETPAEETEAFVIDKSEKESGVHEALKLMRVGEKAKLILPSYLGHGLLGDRESIPPQAVLYIDIELVKLI